MTRYSASGGHAGGWAGGGGPGRGGPSVRFFLPMKAKLGCAMPPQLAKPQKRTAMVKSALPPAPSLWLTRSLPSFLPSFRPSFSVSRSAACEIHFSRQFSISGVVGTRKIFSMTSTQMGAMRCALTVLLLAVLGAGTD